MREPPFNVGERVRIAGHGVPYVVREVRFVTDVLPRATPYWSVKAEEFRKAGARATWHGPAQYLVRA